MKPEKPKTQREIIDQLWYAVIGSNGEGISQTVRRLERDVSQLKTDVATRGEVKEEVQGCLDADAAQDARNGERRRMWAMWAPPLIVAAVSAIASVGGMALFGG